MVIHHNILDEEKVCFLFNAVYYLKVVFMSSCSDEARVNTAVDPRKFVSVVSPSLECRPGLQSNPSSQYPSFFKQLLKSHLSGKFYLGLPKKFCDAHLPSHDDNVVLVDETEQEYTAKYSFRKHRLCCGWRCFSVAHKLLEGDALIFNLVESCKFRVYIVRASKLAESDGAILQSYDAQNYMTTSTVKVEQQMDGNVCIGALARKMYKTVHPVDGHREIRKAVSTPDSKLYNAHYENGINHLDSNIPEGIRYPEPILHFEGMKGFGDFRIQVDGLIMDSEMPADIITKYYELCCSQKMFLHSHLIKGLSSRLVVTMISEIVDISDAIRSANLATSQRQLECWERTLKAFEDLGMVVGFLRDRIHKLASLLHESHSVIESKRRKIAQADKEISNLEVTSFNVKALMGNIAAEVKALKCKNEKLGLDFQQLAGAPW